MNQCISLTFYTPTFLQTKIDNHLTLWYYFTIRYK
ncbi:hypothetical protein CLOBOL_02781 [Enterocloster bolteae ATCC BAA-613]|uniref:Uncharacterized protein n=1 Tax=Enterocloster bolteae (strain ATCC BAA-613 / DSM 15670 / CCUG 46953 / JCM 12243 / WAL 16351) TaxID=411902 RepID=A8RQM5_ENTBW|nr:hypothetical protein CLOBOL_02781 [Enterocloster bolteae ATCC BAA-613]